LRELAADSVRPLVRRGAAAEGRHFVIGRVPVSKFSTARKLSDQGRAFLREYGAAFGVRDPGGELTLRSVERDALGMTHLRYDQRYRGLEVFGRRLLLHVRGEAVTVVNGEFASGIDLPTTPRVARTGAEWTATMAIPARGRRESRAPTTLLVYVDEGGVAHLAWRARVESSRPLGFWEVFVDALTGEVLRAFNDVQTARNRNTYDANNTTSLPGTLRLTEPGCFAPPCDSVELATHANAGVAYDYFSSAHGRDSFNGAGAAISSTAHYGFNYNNAFWCSQCPGGLFDRLVYGDGDGIASSPLGADQDIAVHEFGHGVMSYTANLTYLDQSGALNESLSDVWAAMADNNGDEWLIGESSETPAIPGDAARSMADPTQFGQPGDWSQYRHTFYDNGGVHINSGIPNKAAYLMSTGPGYGIGRGDTQRIYYRALTVYLTPSSDFYAYLNAMLQSATDMFGAGSAQVRAVAIAHGAVGLANPPAVTSPNGAGFLQGGASATIQWNPGQTGLPVAIALVQDSGSATYSQPFGTGPGLPSEFSTGGNAPWFVDTSVQAARSGLIGNSQRSEFSLTRRMTAPGSVTFRVSVNSESGYDFASFFVDGVLRLYGSGYIPMSPVPAVAVPAGTHTFTWVYEKDGLFAPVNDGAWIDDLVIPNVENVSVSTIVSSTAPGATSQPWTVPAVSGANFKIRVHYPGVQASLGSDDSDNLFGIDSGAPTDPALSSRSHRPGVSSRDSTVDIAWSGASDALSGVDGFSYQWDTAAGSVPDAVKDVEENAAGTTSPALPTGRHYFHLRTRDNVGNWTATVHAGPFVISPRRATRVVRCVVPRLRGKTVTQARRLLVARRCRLGRVTRRPSRLRKKRVVSQSRRPGARLPRGTRIGIVVR
jgi:bacillolysin